MDNIRSLVEKSSLWAAYGDALGFITELVEEQSGIKWRSGKSYISHSVPWRRKIGGMFGITVRFPQGTYSDDTQLRLATCRTISSAGVFDVEAFAKIELTTWNSYALGAGRGTKDAAANLTKKNVRWNSNFYKASKNGRSYTDSGGNGAAMRIQPHVWCGIGTKNFSEISVDVVKNTVTTHGHPHAILGSVFHALSLYLSLTTGKIPDPGSWDDLALDSSECIKNAINSDPDLSTLWLSQWNENSNFDFFTLHETSLTEFRDMIATIGNHIETNTPYNSIIHEVGGNIPSIRGMGTLTAALSLAAAYAQETRKTNLLLEVVNQLNTDTDTIGSMMGALIGALPQTKFPEIIQDQSYIIDEANRMADISEGKPTSKFQYPSLLKWTPISKTTDILKKYEDIFIVPGLGEVTLKETAGESQGITWIWGELTFGQTILLKIRLPIASITELTSSKTPYSSIKKIDNAQPQSPQPDLFMVKDNFQIPNKKSNFINLDSNQAFEYAKKNNFSPIVIGDLIIEMSKNDNYALESISLFGVLVAKALIERNKR